MDIVHSFHHFKLEGKPRKLLPFRTPWGFYQFKRMVIGNSPTLPETHRRVRTVIQGCEGVIQIKDDVVVYGIDGQHNRNLEKVLQRFDKAGLTLRQEGACLGSKS